MLAEARTAISGYFRNNSVLALSKNGGKLAQNKQDSIETRATLAEAMWGPMFGGPMSDSGVTVNHETAQRHSAVWACVKIMSEAVSSLSGDVIQDLPNGDRQKLPNHPVAKVLRSPMPGMYNGNTWFETMQAWKTLRGNAISLIIRNGVGTPKSLRHFPLDQVTIDFDPINQMTYYTFWDRHTNKHIIEEAGNVIHIRSMVWDTEEGWGKSPIQVHRNSIGLHLAGQEYMGGILKNGAHIPGILTTDAKLTPESAERLAKSWRARFGGSVNAGNTPVLEQGLKYQALNLSPADAQWLEVNNATIQDVARIFGVPLHMLGSLERSTNNNIEQQALEFVTQTLRPLIKIWEAEFSKLFAPRDQGKVYFKFDLNSLLRGDVKTRATLYDTLLKWGAVNVDEVRRLEGFNAIATGEGKTHLYPVNMAPFDKLGQQEQGAENATNNIPDGEEE
jgi:HK97 family phage portal protein